jgi:hypothetical protein
MLDLREFFRFTFPYHQCFPTLIVQRRYRGAVAHDIPGELLFPEIRPRGWHRRAATILVSMPKATMHEHGQAVSRKH